MVRVAALQFASGTDVEENLATCLRMIDRAAAEHAPKLMVLPEFCNHISWYDDQAHALRVAVPLEGPFLAAIAQRAKQHGAYIVINCSLRREGDRITVTSLMYGPNGELVGQADKQTLMGHENVYFARAEQTSSVVETPLARVALYPCRDGVTMETPRCLSLRGAQVLCNSLNSFALDEASLHVPARGAENKVFVVAANKVGPLVPAELVESVSAATHIPAHFLEGAGESQIVAPDGTVLAVAPRTGEAVVAADIDPFAADIKQRPDGSHLFALRRPDLYRAIGNRPREAAPEPASDVLEVALVSIVDAASIEGAVEAAALHVRTLAEQGARLIVLPELFCFERGIVEDPELAARWFVPAVRRLSEACDQLPVHVVTSLVERVGDETFHMGVLLGQAGIVARQPQLHVPARHAWATPGRRLDTFRLPWGRLAIAVGEDIMVPETAKLLALYGAQVIAAPYDLQEGWELQLGLRSRAAENRVCIAAATRPKEQGASALFDLEREFTIMTEWSERVFDGHINDPIVTRSLFDQAVLSGVLHPDAANNKVMSLETHLLDKRPWWLVGDLMKRGLGVPEEQTRTVEETPSALAAVDGDIEPTPTIEA